MKMRQVRCYRGFASLGARWNIPVFYVLPEMYRIELFICTQCGEIYVVDFENPKHHGRSIEFISGSSCCQKCGQSLGEILRSYPETFRTDDGQIGHFEASRIIPPDSESLVKDFLELG